MTTRETDEQDRIVRQGTAAWVRLKKDKSWTDWLAVGEALRVGRELAMYQAGTNRPEGKGYSQEFSVWLAKNKLDDMDKSDRAKLFTVMDNLSAIELWRATLTRPERMRLNHPVTVLRNWQKATAIPKPAKPNKDDALRDLDEERHLALAEIERLKARIAELEEEVADLRQRLGEAETNDHDRLVWEDDGKNTIAVGPGDRIYYVARKRGRYVLTISDEDITVAKNRDPYDSLDEARAAAETDYAEREA